MNFFESLLSSEGNISTMRMMSFISLFMGCFIAGLGLYAEKDLSAVAVLVSVFVGPAFGFKAVQSFSENRVEK